PCWTPASNLTQGFLCAHVRRWCDLEATAYKARHDADPRDAFVRLCDSQSLRQVLDSRDWDHALPAKKRPNQLQRSRSIDIPKYVAVKEYFEWNEAPAHGALTKPRFTPKSGGELVADFQRRLRLRNNS